jgi:hypothetical protein
MPIGVFLSHTHADKPFVRRLAVDLQSHGLDYWLDEAEIKIGESLVQKIREGIDNFDYLIAVLSPNSIESPWVQRELDIATNQEIAGQKVKVLPVMYKRVEMPGFLLGKRYADFSDPESYSKALKDLVQSMGIVFRSSAVSGDTTAKNLGTAIDKAIAFNLPMFSAPFHRPFQYLGMNADETAKKLNSERNEGGNIVVENDECRFYLEAEGNFISYAEIDIKATAPFFQSKPFDPEPMLGSLSINPNELDLIKSQTHCHTYYDHRKKLKINVMCVHDGGPISVSFGSKYYGM